MNLALIKIIELYQRTFPWIASALGLFFRADCHFLPTCSEYTKEAIGQHGWRKGVFLGGRRVLRCHPLSTGGADLVPRKHFNL